ncbi:phosphotransferase enzyme family protein [Nocardia asteroides]|uniref:phosphotransferase enzyme family protein n=1 Tax=Nocardia asteroides TaxID=1824 RepID=UPI001E5F5B21|nr:aminoglycoside phosphotransferase family protein [Nocardia asteroides]UGT61569.1 aminoglycoside phosphotransferase family protein [Nocardia asteroides]
MNNEDLEAVARAACSAVGLNASDLEPIKVAENAIYRVPSAAIVVRVAKPGQEAAAERELLIADWLRRSGVPAVEPADLATTFVIQRDHPVSFWKELPEHHGATAPEIARALRTLHRLEPAEFLPDIDPFVRLDQRIDAAAATSPADRRWLRRHLAELRERWAERTGGMPWGPIHGDAWDGNVVTTTDGTTLFLDLERASVGPPEWDLTSTAIKRSSFGWISRQQYAGFAQAYGHDVETWPGFPLLRDIREMRMTCMAVQAAGRDSGRARQAQLRVDSLRGRRGPRPWRGWEAMP